MDLLWVNATLGGHGIRRRWAMRLNGTGDQLPSQVSWGYAMRPSVDNSTLAEYVW
jgi:hypothetical protein